jgi:hypothetical protein
MMKDLGFASTELVQLVLTVFLGLLFSTVICTTGWLISYIAIYEIIVYYMFGNTPSYRGFFRLTLNSIFFITAIYGNWALRGECGMSRLLYNTNVSDEGILSTVTNIVVGEIF